MEANQKTIPRVPDILKREQIQQMVSRISARLSHLLSSVSGVVGSGPEYQKEESQLLGEAFKSISYEKQLISGPICRFFDTTVKYYRCFTCQINKGACICQKCFTNHHQAHQFKIMEGVRGFCDCGNPQYLRKQYFCDDHSGKNKQVTSKLQKKDVDLFNREVQFLLYLCLKIKYETNNSSQSQYIAFKVIQIIHEACLNSYTYQRLTSEIFLRSFSKEYLIGLQGETIFHLFLWEEWRNQQLLRKFAQLLCQLYSYQKMRKNVLIQYFKLHCSLNKFVIWVNPITYMDQQYFLQGNLILKYIKSGKIPPLTLNYQFVNINSTAGCFMQIYRAYKIMSYTVQFTQILYESLKRISFTTFYSFGVIDRESRAAITIVTKNFILFLDIVIRTVQKMKESKQIFLKIIRQSYAYIKKKEQIYNFCPQRTLLSSLFSIQQYDLSRIVNLSISEMLQLFEENCLLSLKENLQKMLQSYINLFRIENFNDYREMIADTIQYQLNTTNFVVAALDYTCIKILLTLLQTVLKEYSIVEYIPLRNAIIGKFHLLQKWVHLYRVEKGKKDAIVDPQAKNQITNLMETGLFIKINDQIASTAIQFVSIVNNLLFACESSLCEIVLSNHFQKPNQQKIFMIYRQCAWLSHDKPRLQFKKVIEHLIDNKKLIKSFITQQYDQYFKGEKMEGQKYESNISYCSRFFNDEVTDDTSQRFMKKLQSKQTQNYLTTFIFTQDLISQIIKFTKYYIKFLLNSQIQLTQETSISITMNLLLESLIVVYTETKSQKLRNLIEQINGMNYMVQNYTDYTKIIVGLLFQYFNKKPEIVEQAANKKQAAKLKRDLKMKQMKQKQDKFLQQHSMGQQKIQQNQDLCIICKTPSSIDNNLNYLCRIRFNNTFHRNILKHNDNMMVITTCRHKIHEKCLAQSIDERDQYGMNYSCFLCKELSNLRLPLNLNNQNIQLYMQYFLTIVSLELNSNSSLKHLVQEYTTPHRLCKLLYDSIVLSIYFYYFTVGKFYAAYIVPIVEIQFIILRWLVKTLSAPKSVFLDRKDSVLNVIEEKVNSILAENKIQQNNTLEGKEKQQKYELDQLFSRIFLKNQAKISEIKHIQRFNFYKLPKDLRSLVKQTGKCTFCKKFNNKAFICFLCGFKICGNCNQQMNIHIDSHLGTSVLIDVQNGKYCYRYRNMQVSYISLYSNYIGEEFQDDSQLPPKGQYELSQDRLEKLIDEILKDCIQNTVVVFFNQAEQVPLCNVQ